MFRFLQSRSQEQQIDPSVIFNEVDLFLEQERAVIEQERQRLRDKMVPHLGELAAREENTFEFIVLEARNDQLKRVSLGIGQIRDAHVGNVEQ